MNIKPNHKILRKIMGQTSFILVLVMIFLDMTPKARARKAKTNKRDYINIKSYCAVKAEKEMATHPSVLAWISPGKVEPGGLPSMGSHRVGKD